MEPALIHVYIIDQKDFIQIPVNYSQIFHVVPLLRLVAMLAEKPVGKNFVIWV